MVKRLNTYSEDRTGKEDKPKKRPMEEYIDEAAEKGARKVLMLQRKAQITNHYRAMEDLLRSYKNVKLWEEHPEEYGFFPVEKSHSVSIAPPPGSGIRDSVEVNELFVQSRQLSFVRSMTRFTDLEAVIKLFEARPEFIIIRMYYFGEDAHGQPRGADAKPYTFAEISEALKGIGINLAEKAIRRRRTKLVQEMTVMMFGTDGALSIASREPKQKGGGGNDGATDPDRSGES